MQRRLGPMLLAAGLVILPLSSLPAEDPQAHVHSSKPTPTPTAHNSHSAATRQSNSGKLPPALPDTRAQPSTPDIRHLPPALPDTRSLPPALPDTRNLPPALPDTRNLPPALPDTRNLPPALPGNPSETSGSGQDFNSEAGADHVAPMIPRSVESMSSTTDSPTPRSDRPQDSWRMADPTYADQPARGQRTQLQSLTRQGIAIAEQIHQDEVAEQDASARLADSQTHLKQVNSALNLSLTRLNTAQQRLKLDRQGLKQRLREVYEQGNVGILECLLNSHNILDFMNRREYSQRIVNRDLGIVQQVRLDESDISTQSQALAFAQVQQAQEVQSIQFQTNRLQSAIADRSAVLQAAEQQSGTAQESLAEMETQSTSIQEMLRQIQSLPVLTVPGPLGQRLQYRLHFAGQFVLPASGPVTSPFGYRYHPILHVYKLHTGVDIGASYGSAVHAAGAGVVVHAGWLGAYGNGIILDHGDGLATLYGHLSQVEVSVGQAIGQGQEIGKVGSTGLATGPHLHFEVRKYGTPVPPL